MRLTALTLIGNLFVKEQEPNYYTTQTTCQLFFSKSIEKSNQPCYNYQFVSPPRQQRRPNYTPLHRTRQPKSNTIPCQNHQPAVLQSDLILTKLQKSQNPIPNSSHSINIGRLKSNFSDGLCLYNLQPKCIFI